MTDGTGTVASRSDQIRHVEQPPTLISMGQCQIRHDTNTNYCFCNCWTRADLQKQTGNNLIYNGPDVVQNHYEDQF